MQTERVWYEWQEAPPAKLGVIGDPISHSLSPQMQRAALAELGRVEDYEAIRVPSIEFEVALDELQRRGYEGLNVTVPLKEAAFRWAGEVDELTQKIGAANTLRLPGREATNTDAPGILDILEQERVPEGANVLLLGAGGTARAALYALTDKGYDVSIWNRTRARAEGLVRGFFDAVPILDDPDPGNKHVLLNTTSASLLDEDLPIAWERAERGALAIDLAYGEGPTRFMRSAENWGLRTMDGRPLLVAQGARSLEWWLGIEAPRSAMLKAIS